MYATGLEAGIPKIQAAMQKLAAPTMLNLKASSPSYPGQSNSSAAILAAVASGGTSSASANSNQVIENHIYIDGKEVTSKLGPHIANAIRATGVRSR